MRALGAELTLIPSDGGRTTKRLVETMIETARKLSEKPGTCWIDQLNNVDHIAGYHSLGHKIWEQSNAQVNAFVQCVGTAASIQGGRAILRQTTPEVKIVAVEPAESAILSGGETGAYNI